MNRTIYHWTVAAALLMAGCVTSRPETHTVDSSAITFPNGAKGYVIHCPGKGVDLSACSSDATRLCGGLYGAVDSTGTASPSPQAVNGILTVACLAP